MGYDLTLGDCVHSHARAFTTHPAFELIAAADPLPARRHAFEEHYRAPAYPSFEKALRQHAVDLVVIATPTSTHDQVLKRTVELSEPKMILCEKPLSDDLQQAREMVDRCAGLGIPLFVNYVRRSEPGVNQVKQRIVSGEIAVPVRGVAWYSNGWIHNASHFVNLLEHWIGPILSAQTLSVEGSNESNTDPDVRVEFRNGAVIFLALSGGPASHHSLEILAPNGRLRYDLGGESITWQGALPDHHTGIASLELEPHTIPSDMRRYQWHVADQIAAALDGESFELCTGREALTSLEIMLRIVQP
jgi:predicted dehydrogenase